MPIYLQAPSFVPAVQRSLADGSVEGLPLGYAGLVLLPAVSQTSFQWGVGHSAGGGGGAGRTQGLIIAI
jgi:hypothetical protein